MKKLLKAIAATLTLVGLFSGSLRAQTARLSLDQAVQQGLKSNTFVQSAKYESDRQRSLRRTSSDIGKTTVTGMFGQYNSYAKADNNISITQSIPFPTTFAARSSLGAAYVRGSELQLAATENELSYQVKSTWYQLAYLHELNKWYVRADSLWRGFARAAGVRQQTGETNLLEKVTAESRSTQAQTLLIQNRADIEIFAKRLQTLLAATSPVDINSDTLTIVTLPPIDTTGIMQNPQLQLSRQQVEIAAHEKQVEKSALAPDLMIGYFNQTLIGTPINESGTPLATSGNRFQGFQAGFSIPLWFKPQASRVKAAEYNRLSAQSRYQQDERNYKGELTALTKEVFKLSSSLQYYNANALPQAELILKQSTLAFRNGEIAYVEYVQALTTAADIQTGYLDIMNQYNQAAVRLEYLLAIR